MAGWTVLFGGLTWLTWSMRRTTRAAWLVVIASIAMLVFTAAVSLSVIDYRAAGELELTERNHLYSLFVPLALTVSLLNTSALAALYLRRPLDQPPAITPS